MKHLKWKTGSRIKTNVRVAHEELERIRSENNGFLEKQKIVDESKPKKAVLHDEFEWNNAIAANEHRKEQARHIVRSVVVETDDQPNQVREYSSIIINRAGEDVNVYSATREIMATSSGRAELLQAAIRDAIAFKRRYQSLDELSKLIDIIDEFTVS